MHCKKCKAPALAETVDGKKTVVRCTKCGLTEVKDERGASLLTGEKSTVDRPLLG